MQNFLNIFNNANSEILISENSSGVRGVTGVHQQEHQEGSAPDKSSVVRRPCRYQAIANAINSNGNEMMEKEEEMGLDCKSVHSTHYNPGGNWYQIAFAKKTLFVLEMKKKQQQQR